MTGFFMKFTLALRMAFDAGEIGLKNDGIFYEVHACLRVCIGGVLQMILRLAEKSIHSMGRLCFRVGQTIAFCRLSHTPVRERNDRRQKAIVCPTGLCANGAKRCMLTPREGYQFETSHFHRFRVTRVAICRHCGRSPPDRTTGAGVFAAVPGGRSGQSEGLSWTMGGAVLLPEGHDSGLHHRSPQLSTGPGEVRGAARRDPDRKS